MGAVLLHACSRHQERLPAQAAIHAGLCVLFLVQGFTKKLQSELTTQYLRKVGGAADQQQQHPHQQAASPFATSVVHSSAGPSSSSLNRPMGVHAPSSSSGAGPGPSSAAAAAAVAAGSGLTSPIGSGFGGLPPSGGSGSGAASNLSALKMSVNSFTRELASSMSTIGRATGGAGSGAGSPQARAEKVRGEAHQVAGHRVLQHWFCRVGTHPKGQLAPCHCCSSPVLLRCCAAAVDSVQAWRPELQHAADGGAYS